MAAAGARKGLCFHDPASIADYYMERLRHEDQEVLLCMMLDTKNQLLGEKETASVGMPTPVVKLLTICREERDFRPLLF